ncbi:MAG: adenosylcobinamide-GDP ribazoletransferase [Selenomonadaceae bacterium]|nr:adenosylcobinamide-GDP ribazoletransferase [Selenomonadaceae bacterium]
MNEFLIGLQFLTRISVVRQTVWTEESFGGSVKFFPLVGAVIGICYALAIGGLIFLTGGGVPIFTGAVGFFLSVWLTGAIHCDGLMDSADGVFSGREREKMLEIMKDSRAGAFGVVALVTVAALEISTLAELVKISLAWSCAAVFAAPVIGRLAMVLVIAMFPYARPAGLGKSFAQFTTRKTLALAAGETVLLLTPLIFFSEEIFLAAIVALAIALVFALEFGKFATAKLGGVTGDIYGAAEFLSEVLALTTFLLIAQ